MKLSQRITKATHDIEAIAAGVSVHGGFTIGNTDDELRDALTALGLPSHWHPRDIPAVHWPAIAAHQARQAMAQAQELPDDALIAQARLVLHYNTGGARDWAILREIGVRGLHERLA